MNIVIVESPAKAKTIKKYLGLNFKVFASYGHIRDLRSKDGSVDPENNFQMNWLIDVDSKKRLNEIIKELKSAKKLILATDPDREGEAISWHVLEVLNKKCNLMKNIIVERVVFNAITKKSILKAMNNPRKINILLVEAYLARRALDYLVGFSLSPILWRKLPGARSAGRVQSVSLRLICEREYKIETFDRKEYWTIETNQEINNNYKFKTKLWSINNKPLEKMSITTEKFAEKIKNNLINKHLKIIKIEKKDIARYPYTPFTTSTMQQEAFNKFGFDSFYTMQIAQKLYEGVLIDGEMQGLITYIRTDGVTITQEIIDEIRNFIKETISNKYLSLKQRLYQTKIKNAQEAHEAIRPTYLIYHPKKICNVLSVDQFKLYNLIWCRTIASQMENAKFKRTTVIMETKGNDNKIYTFKVSNTVMIFDGFLKIYHNNLSNKTDKCNKKISELSLHQTTKILKILSIQHFTEPPSRFSEASLICKMEELGIGRPSTYTSIISTLRNRDYVRLEKKRLYPEVKGRLVTAFLENFFKKYIQYDFTANLEQNLDNISTGNVNWQVILQKFWIPFNNLIQQTKNLRITEVLNKLNESLSSFAFPKSDDNYIPRNCIKCKKGELSLKVGRYGAFIGCSNYPNCNFTRELGVNNNKTLNLESKILGIDPKTNLEVILKYGRYGPYIQLGKLINKIKPKRSIIPKHIDPLSIKLELAINLLKLPRILGNHPDDGLEIKAGIGRYGAFILHNKIFTSIINDEEILTINLNDALILLAKKRNKIYSKSIPLKILGKHPKSGDEISLYNGRYGLYIKFKKNNITIKKTLDPEEITIKVAIEHIEERKNQIKRST